MGAAADLRKTLIEDLRSALEGHGFEVKRPRAVVKVPQMGTPVATRSVGGMQQAIFLRSGRFNLAWMGRVMGSFELLCWILGAPQRNHGMALVISVSPQGIQPHAGGAYFVQSTEEVPQLRSTIVEGCTKQLVPLLDQLSDSAQVLSYLKGTGSQPFTLANVAYALGEDAVAARWLEQDTTLTPKQREHFQKTWQLPRVRMG